VTCNGAYHFLGILGLDFTFLIWHRVKRERFHEHVIALYEQFAHFSIVFLFCFTELLQAEQFVVFIIRCFARNVVGLRKTLGFGVGKCRSDNIHYLGSFLSAFHGLFGFF